MPELSYDPPLPTKTLTALPEGFVQTIRLTASGKPAADCEGERDELSGEQRRHGDGAAHDRARVRTRDQAEQEGAFEREIGGIVPQQHARDGAGRERKPHAEGENEAIAQVAALEDQDLPEAPVPHQHRRQQRHHRQLEDERRQQQLLRVEDFGLHGRRNCTIRGRARAAARMI